MAIINKLLDLQRQATTEESHFYTASVLTEAIQEIVSLRSRLASADTKREDIRVGTALTDIEREEIMVKFDKVRDYIAGGGRSSYPSDFMVSVLDWFDERLKKRP